MLTLGKIDTCLRGGHHLGKILLVEQWKREERFDVWNDCQYLCIALISRSLGRYGPVHMIHSLDKGLLVVFITFY